MANKLYFTWDRLNNTNSTYMLAIGARSIGKSYAAKRDAIKAAFKNPKARFGLVRRWKEDLKQNLVEQYFQDMPVSEYTDGKYNNIRIWQGKIYLSNYDVEKMQWKPEKMLIGYTFALNLEQHYKSTMYPDIKYLLFEEFISNTYYLPDEPTMLDSLVSTIARDREIKVYCIGNSISRMSPYFRHWQLEHTLNQKQGTIEIYDNKLENGNIVSVAVEMCDNVIEQKMFFGNSRNMTVTGHWQADEHPKLQYDFNEYSSKYEIFLFKEALKYRMRLFKHNPTNNYVWFVEPFTKEYQQKPHTRVISDIYNEDRLHTVGFHPLSDKERVAFNLITLGKVAFSDNLTGTEFYRILAQMKAN